MGEQPPSTTLELTCPGCQAHFRLRPKKKMPKNAVPCPKCGTAIPLPETAPKQAPEAQILSGRSPKTTPPAPQSYLNQSPKETFLGLPKDLEETDTIPAIARGPQDATVSIDEQTWEKVKQSENVSEQKGSTTDPSFHKQQREVDDADEAASKEKENTKEIPKIDFGNIPDQGPFDMRDIISAEQHSIQDPNPNDVTRNPLLSPDNMMPGIPKEDDLLGAPMSAEETLAIASLPLEKEERSEELPPKEQPLETEESREETLQESPPPLESSQKEALGALIRKKLGTQKIKDLRSKVEDAIKESQSEAEEHPRLDDLSGSTETHGFGSEPSLLAEDTKDAMTALPVEAAPAADQTLETPLSDELSEQIRQQHSSDAASHSRPINLAGLDKLRSPLRDDPNAPKSERKPVVERSNRNVSWNQFSPGGQLSDAEEAGVAPSQRVTGRTRGRQESHSGLFPIRGVGNEASAVTGNATERRGSGYIRLPTTEIMEVLGEGNYRLMVENIVYEPVDEKSLTELIKRGVLMGAEMIAKPGEEWQPINDHPVFRRLRKKMAMETHALLAKYKAREVTPDKNDPPEPAQEAPQQEEEKKEAKLPMPPPLPEQGESLPKRTLMMGSLNLAKKGSQEESSSEELDDPFDSIVDLSSELETHPSLFEPDSEPLEVPEKEEAQESSVGETKTELLYDVSEEEPPREESGPAFGLQGPDFSSIVEDDSEVDAEDDEDDEEEEYLIPPGVQEEAPAHVSDTMAVYEDDDSTELPRRSNLLPILLFVLALIGIGLLGYFVYENYIDTPGKTPVVVTPPVDPPVVSETPVEDAVVVAKGHRQGATLAMATSSESLQSAMTLASKGDQEGALVLFQESWGAKEASLEQSLAYIKALEKKGGQEAKMSQVAQAAMAKSGGKDERFAPYIKKATLVTKGWDPVEVTPGGFGDKVALEAVGKLQTLVVLSGQEKRWSFTPVQPRYGQDYAHRDVAASRLCEAIQCDILVPKVQWARMNEASFTAMGGTKEMASKLSWSKDKKGRYLRGSMKQWVPEGLAWPIEYSNLWRPWLAPYEAKAKLEAPLSQSLDGLRKQNEALFSSILKTPGLSTKRLAQQVSAMVVFDYLTNNMNRFKERPVFNGTDNQLLGTQLVSLDHAKTFQSRLSSRVAGRFGWVGRYDKALIERIKGLDKAQVDAMLFGKGSALGQGEKRAFWARHADLLKDIEAQTTRYGAKEVFPF